MTVIKIVGWCLALTLAAPWVRADWTDPLNSAAVPSARATSALMLDITSTPAGRLVAVGAHGIIVYSDDQGKSWQQASVPVRVTLMAVQFSSTDNGVAVGHDGAILHSRDGGLNWSLQFDGDAANEAMIDASARLLAQAEARLDNVPEDAEDGVIEDAEYAAEDALFALEDAEYDRDIRSFKPLLDIEFIDRDTGFAVGAYGMAFETRDGGRSWNEFTSRLPLSLRPHFNDIAEAAYGRLYLVGESGQLLTSDDRGRSWQRLESPYEGSLFGLMADNDRVLLMGLRGHLFESSDAGQNWIEIPSDNEQTLIGYSQVAEHSVLAGNGGTLLTLAADNQLNTMTIQGRKALAAVVAVDGGYVLAGEAGLQRVDRAGGLLPRPLMTHSPVALAEDSTQ